MNTFSDDMPEDTTRRRITSIVLLVVLILLYIVSTLYVTISARSQATIEIRGFAVPFSAFTGVFSSIGNLCTIFMVIYFGKKGFIAALGILLLQYPMVLQGILIRHGVNSIPGVFTNTFTIIAVILIHQRNRKIDKYQQEEVRHLRERQKLSHRLFEQTATALVNAIDAKDTYSHGHSIRVAEYSRMIAERMGKDEEECERIYYAALLHDVGKIGIDDSIINKNGKLTEEEYAIIKTHPTMGNQILSGISEYPYLSIGAKSHHERYDGKGYPERLKGEDIPETARIISVADAYDAMTSNRSYRAAIPQQLVREEIVKGMGTQFDPNIARIMQNLIDEDPEYHMKEEKMAPELGGKRVLLCEEERGEVSEGIVITQYPTQIHLSCLPMPAEPEEDGEAGEEGYPMLVLFDALDGRYHNEERTIRELLYYEYCEIRFDGTVNDSGVRKIETRVREKESGRRIVMDSKKGVPYDIEAVKYKDHVMLRLDDGLKIMEVTAALPDSSRYVYIGLTGKRCQISDVRISRSEKAVGADAIPRIAEEISYIDDPEGDIPNLQVDGQCTAATEGIEITDGMKIYFHTKSLPTARLIWHCPYLDIFTSDDRRVNGKNYREYALIRLDGEDWQRGKYSENRLIVNKNDNFGGWEAWKQINREGMDCVVKFEQEGSKIVTMTENSGLAIRCTTTIKDGREGIYVALTGDQCAITDIRIKR